MRVTLKAGMLILATETPLETEALGNWADGNREHVFHLVSGSGKGAAFQDLGAHDEACGTPINIVYSGDARWRPISNLAQSRFELHGRRYASVEGFWQGLKVDDEAERRRIGALWGNDAKRATRRSPSTFEYEGKSVVSGTYDHWTLMFQACLAKFAQDAEARAALMATGTRPLTHRVRHDSRVIPGVLMADIWMRVRSRLNAPKGQAFSRPVRG